MGRRAVASANPILTNFAAGLAPELANPLARFISPVVPVSATIGHYKRYDDKNAFQTYETERALGGDRVRLTFKASDPTYDCKPNGLETTIDDDELDAAGADDPLSLRQAKIRVLLGNAMRSHTYKLFTAIDAAVAAEANVGVWSDPNIDPVAQIDQLIETMAIDTGIMPNRILLDIHPWNVFRNHPKVKARCQGVQVTGVSESQASSIFLTPLQLRIGAIPRDSTKAGKTKANVSITANRVYLFYASDSPDQYDPSFCKTFMGGRGGVDQAGFGRETTKPYEVVWVDWNEDNQITSSACGKKLVIS